MTITKEILLADLEKLTAEAAFFSGRVAQIKALLQYMDAPEPPQSPAPDAKP